jgi:uncharacterized protein YigA (DUF484 family)
MSIGNSEQDESRPLDEDTVVDHLRAHPDFFERHPRLIEGLNLPHGAGGDTVSLVERQVSVLRQKNRELEDRLRQLVDVARSNESLAQRIHRLATRLLEDATGEHALETLESCLREDFGANQTVVVLFHDSSEIIQEPDTRFLRRMSRTSPALKSFATFLDSGLPRCGRVRDAQKEFLFPGDGALIASVALVPLGPRCATGMMAIGSRDAERFNPTMSTDFLARIGDLATAALTGCRRRENGGAR